jgi:hypothetical protein
VANVLDFFRGSTLVAEFSTTNLLSKLPASYKGNPTSGFKGQDSGDPFGFTNFFGQPGTTGDHIVFNNNAGSGFESDNHTLRVVGEWDDPDPVTAA